MLVSIGIKGVSDECQDAWERWCEIPQIRHYLTFIYPDVALPGTAPQWWKECWAACLDAVGHRLETGIALGEIILPNVAAGEILPLALATVEPDSDSDR